MHAKSRTEEKKKKNGKKKKSRRIRSGENHHVSLTRTRESKQLKQGGSRKDDPTERKENKTGRSLLEAEQEGRREEIPRISGPYPSLLFFLFCSLSKQDTPHFLHRPFVLFFFSSLFVFPTCRHRRRERERDARKNEENLQKTSGRLPSSSSRGVVH